MYEYKAVLTYSPCLKAGDSGIMRWLLPITRVWYHLTQELMPQLCRQFMPSDDMMLTLFVSP